MSGCGSSGQQQPGYSYTSGGLGWNTWKYVYGPVGSSSVRWQGGFPSKAACEARQRQHWQRLMQRSRALPSGSEQRGALYRRARAMQGKPCLPENPQPLSSAAGGQVAAPVPAGPSEEEIAAAVLAGAELLGALGGALFGSSAEREAAERALRAVRRRNLDYARGAFDDVDPVGGVGCVDFSTDDQTCEGWDDTWSPSSSWKSDDDVVECVDLFGDGACVGGDPGGWKSGDEEAVEIQGPMADDPWKAGDEGREASVPEGWLTPSCDADPEAFAGRTRDLWDERCATPPPAGQRTGRTSTTDASFVPLDGLEGFDDALPVEETPNILAQAEAAARDVLESELVKRGQEQLRRLLSPDGRALFDVQLRRLNWTGNAAEMVTENMERNFGPGSRADEACATYDHDQFQLWLGSLIENVPVRRCP